MTDKTEEHNGEQDRVRRLLKDIPKVQASPDFEARLQRRVHEEAGSHVHSGLLQRLFSPGRIPVFAYSLTAMVLVCIISYYAFFRSGEVLQQEPVISKNLQPQSQADTAPAKPDRSAEKQDVRPEDEMKIASTPRSKDSKNARADGREELQKKSLAAGESRNTVALKPGNLALDKKKESGVPLSSVPVPAAARENMPETESAHFSAAAAPESAHTAKRIAGQAAMKQLHLDSEVAGETRAFVSVDRQIETITRQIDSLGLKDSLRVDSLRRVRRVLIIQQQLEHQQKAKIRKPL